MVTKIYHVSIYLDGFTPGVGFSATCSSPFNKLTRTITLETGKISSDRMATSEEPQFEYDMFLSHNRRERDAGSFFPQHLHDALNLKGIKSYKYGEDLEEGEEMAPAIDEAIKGS